MARAQKFFGLRAKQVDEIEWSGDLQPLPGWANSALIALLRLENRLLLWGLNFPWGVSAMVVGRRRR